MTNKKNSIVAAAAALMLVFVLCACSFNGGLSVGAYVDRVDNDVHEIVNITRELKKKTDGLDCRKKTDAESFISSLDRLSELYTDLIKTEAPDHYNDLDSEIKPDAELAISYISSLREMASTASNTGDDSVFNQKSAAALASYEEVYLEIVDLGSQVKTRYRND